MILPEIAARMASSFQNTLDKTCFTFGEEETKMTIFILTFVIFLLVVFAMAIGWIVARKRVQGSCGGLAAVGVDRECGCEEVCDEHADKLYQINEPNSETSSPN